MVKVDKKMVYDIMLNHLSDFERYILIINDNFIQPSSIR